EFAFAAHQGQLRKSGEPYIVHPVAVAEILAELGLDAGTLMAGLLHDTVEDTEVKPEDIEERFGTAVRRIVEGETKVSKL
ncbi:HD domain-containing protein, partial [Vibrio parahaemolyticus]